jgi:hypothetical protein
MEDRPDETIDFFWISMRSGEESLSRKHRVFPSWIGGFPYPNRPMPFTGITHSRLDVTRRDRGGSTKTSWSGPSSRKKTAISSGCQPSGTVSHW